MIAWIVVAAITVLLALAGALLNIVLLYSLFKASFTDTEYVVNPGFVPYATELFLAGRAVAGFCHSLVLIVSVLPALADLSLSCEPLAFISYILLVQDALMAFFVAVDNEEFGEKFAHITPLWARVILASFTIGSFVIGLLFITGQSIDLPFCLAPTSAHISLYGGIAPIFWAAAAVVQLRNTMRLRQFVFADYFRQPSPPGSLPRGKSTATIDQQTKDLQDRQADANELTSYFNYLRRYHWATNAIAGLRIATYLSWLVVSGGYDNYGDVANGTLMFAALSYGLTNLATPYLTFWRFRRHGNMLVYLTSRQPIANRVAEIPLAGRAGMVDGKENKDGFDDLEQAVDTDNTVTITKSSTTTGRATFTAKELDAWTSYDGYGPYDIKLVASETDANAFEFHDPKHVSFFKLVCNPRTRVLIKKHLSKIKTPEPVEFELQVQVYKDECGRMVTQDNPIPGRDEMLRIIDRYIKDGAPQQINISGVHAEAIEKDYNEKPRLDGTEFDDACLHLENDTLREIRNLVLNDVHLPAIKDQMVRDVLAKMRGRKHAFRAILVSDFMDPMPLWFCCRRRQPGEGPN